MVWPFGRDTIAAAVHGEVTMRVTLVDGRVTIIERQASPSNLLFELASATVRQWYLPGFPNGTTRDLVLRHHRGDSADPCALDPNQVIVATVPDLIEVTTPVTALCNPTLTVEGLPDMSEVILGSVRCACLRRNLIAGAYVRIRSEVEREAPWKEVRTDRNGQFRVSGLRPGRYAMTVSSSDHDLREFTFRVDPGKRESRLQIALKRAAPIPRPATIVTAGMLPHYPENARRKLIAGEVLLRLSMDGDGVMDVDTDGSRPELAAAAIANVRTWQFRATAAPVVSVRFEYVLNDRSCGVEPKTTVTMRLPHHVVIRSQGLCGQVPSS